MRAPVARLPGILAAALLATAFSTPVVAQTSPNLLMNAGFSNNPPASCGNNLWTPPWPSSGYPVSPWQATGSDRTNLVVVGGNCPPYSPAGPDTDAEGSAPGTHQYYLDVYGINDLYQTVTVPTCAMTGPTPVTITYSGYFSARDNATPLFHGGYIAIQDGAYDLTGVNELSRINASDLNNSSWKKFEGTVAHSVTPGQQLTFVVELVQRANFDNASLTIGIDCSATTLTLQKVWAAATAGDSAALTVSRSGT